MVNRVEVIRIPHDTSVPSAGITAPDWSNINDRIDAGSTGWTNAVARGADPTGAADSYAAISGALASSDNLFLPEGTYIVSQPITLAANQMIQGRSRGRTVIRAMDGTDFENVIQATSQDGIVIRDLTVDANRPGRAAALDAAARRTLGISLSGCTNALVQNVTALNACGNGTIPGVGIASTGNNSRILDCLVKDCGIPGKAADGIFSAGTNMLIANCVAENCTDTGFVLERTNRGTIADCIAINCSAGAGIAATTVDDWRGNSIRGITVVDWNAANTGGIQLLTNNTGNLLDTQLSDIVLIQGATGGRVGSALMMRSISTGKINNVTIDNIHITGAEDHGINVNAENVTINGGAIRSVNVGGQGAACIRVEAPTRNLHVRGVTMVGGNANFVCAVSDGASGVRFEGCSIDGSSVALYGIYFFGTVGEAYALWNDIRATVTGRIGSDAGTTPRVIGRAVAVNASGLTLGKEEDVNLYRRSSDILKTDDLFIATSGIGVGNSTASTTPGALARKTQVYDANGASLGYVYIYSS